MCIRDRNTVAFKKYMITVVLGDFNLSLDKIRKFHLKMCIRDRPIPAIIAIPAPRAHPPRIIPIASSNII